MSDLSKDDVKDACIDAIKEYEAKQIRETICKNNKNAIWKIISGPKKMADGYILNDNSIDLIIKFFLSLILDIIGYGGRVVGTLLIVLKIIKDKAALEISVAYFLKFSYIIYFIPIWLFTGFILLLSKLIDKEEKFDISKYVSSIVAVVTLFIAVIEFCSKIL